MNNVYSVNGKGFISFLDAVAYASPIGADVFQIDNGLRRWTPLVRATKRRVRHVLVNADGTKTEIGKVRQ